MYHHIKRKNCIIVLKFPVGNIVENYLCFVENYKFFKYEAWCSLLSNYNKLIFSILLNKMKAVDLLCDILRYTVNYVSPWSGNRWIANYVSCHIIRKKSQSG